MILMLASKAVLIEKEKYPRDKLCGGALHKWMDKTDILDLGYRTKSSFRVG